MKCPKCQTEMEYEPGDSGEPPSWDCPMGGSPPVAAGWVCECGEFVPDDDDSPDPMDECFDFEDDD